MDYDARVLPSVCNEVLKNVVAQHDAATLLAQRDAISYMIRNALNTRLRDFNIVLDDVSIVDMQFS